MSNGRKGRPAGSGAQAERHQHHGNAIDVTRGIADRQRRRRRGLDASARQLRRRGATVKSRRWPVPVAVNVPAFPCIAVLITRALGVVVVITSVRLAVPVAVFTEDGPAGSAPTSVTAPIPFSIHVPVNVIRIVPVSLADTGIQKIPLPLFVPLAGVRIAAARVSVRPLKVADTGRAAPVELASEPASTTSMSACPGTFGTV